MALWDKLDGFDPVSLDELDRRAALQKRVDQKYIVGGGRLARVFDDLRADHEALEIDGERTFKYRSVYFDTPDLRSFTEHIDGRRPRFKLRTRHYVTTSECVFEVKLKREDGETAKHSVDYDGAAEGRLNEAAFGLIDEALGDEGIALPGEIRPTLITQFSRSTLGLRDGPERVTVDRGLRLSCNTGNSLVMNDDVALLETKTADGSGRCDRALADAGAEPLSFSKYRLGVGRLIAAQDDSDYAEPLMRHFTYEATPADNPAARIFDAHRSAELGVGMAPPPGRALGD